MNKGYLLDTQIMLWILEESPKITPDLRKVLIDKKNKVFFSQVSLWEIAIKQKIGKLPHVDIEIKELAEQLLRDGYDCIHLSNEHIYTYGAIPLFENHRDPFDRLLLASALAEQLTFISADHKMALYREKVNLYEVL